MNNKEVSDGRDIRAVVAQSVTAYYSFLLHRGEMGDKKALNRGWPTRGL